MEDVRTRRGRAVATAAVATALASMMALVGCDLNNPGVPVPARTLNFPIAIALAGDPAAPSTLLVANSNFDLRYSSGTLQSYSIAAIEGQIAGCPDGETPCIVEDDVVASFIQSEVGVGSHMDAIALSTARDRVYLAVRSGTGGLTWLSLDGSGNLGCNAGGTGEVPSCDAAHRRADETIASQRGISLPADPVALAVGTLDSISAGTPGDYIVMAHRNGAISLFLDTHTSPDEPPRHVDTITGGPFDIVSIEADGTGLVWLTSGSRDGARATRDLVAVEVIPTLYAGAFSAELALTRRVTMRGIDDALDTRDIAIDPSRGPDEPRIWVLSRRPESIITVDFALDPFAANEAPIGAIHAVGFGPSRLERFDLDFDPGGVGDVRTLLVATCYDAHSLFIVDPELGPIATVAGMDGPFEVAIDPSRARAYVVDFRFSVVWVVDLDPLRTGGSPRVLARLGSGHAPSVFR